jgi:transcriptional regulator with PAS, ATPase and Fis domain
LTQSNATAQFQNTDPIDGYKELLARAIHHNSRRRNQPFIAINCGAIPKDLVESELFGYVRGAFTGAQTNKPGRIEAADGGTLFLDEIGELPLDAQVKLLRVLQEGELTKLGADTQTKVDVRIIAATHRNLPAMVEDETFREDLYYRLAVVPLMIPPLRERREDLPELIDVLLERAKTRHGMHEVKLSSQVQQRLITYRWPGNVRQVENVLERMLVLSASDLISIEDLPEELASTPNTPASFWPDLPEEGVSLEAIERDLISRALEKFAGNQTHAARYLDISRRTLIYRLEKHGLTPTDAA